MVDSKPFSQYLAEARAKRGVGTTAAPSAFKAISIPTTAGAPGKQDTLSWIVDMLSRPMRTVENVPNQIFNEMAKAQAAEKAGTQYDVLGGIGNVVTSPIRGFFSNNPEDQPTGAQLIEKGTDVIGGYDPNYVNVENNVNPWVAGGAGLALDIGLDPLTWVPGAQFAKVGQLASKGIKGAAAAADIAVAGTNLGKSLGAAERIAARAAAAKTASINEARNAAAEVMRNAPTARLRDTAFESILKPKADLKNVIRPATQFEAPVVPGLASKVSETLSKTIKLKPDELKFFEGLAAKEEKAAKAAAKAGEIAKTEQVASDAIVAEGASLLDSLGVPANTLIRDQWEATGAVDNVLATLGKIQETKVTVPTAKAAEPLPFDKWSKQQIAEVAKDPANAGFTYKTAELKAEYKTYLDEFKAANPKNAPAVEKTLTATQSLKTLLTDPATEKELIDALGAPVVEKLSKVRRNDQLTGAVAHLAKVVRGEEVAGTNMQAELAQQLRKRYDIKVPDTSAPAMNGTSAVGTELIAEVQVAEAAGKDLKDVPWIGGYTENQIEEVIQDLPSYYLDDLLNLKGYDWVTNRGALSTSATKGEGLHKFANEYNQYDQYSIYEALIKRDRKRIEEFNDAMRKSKNRGAVVAADRRASDLKYAAMKKVELSLRHLDEKGASIWMGVNKDRIRLMLPQMLSVFNDVARAKGGPNILDIILFNTETTVPITNVMDAVVAMYKNPAITDAELSALLRNPVNKADNFLLGDKLGTFGHFPGKIKPKTGTWRVNKDDNKNIVGWYRMWSPAEIEDATIAMLRGSSDDIQKVVLHNEEMALARTIAEAKDLSDDVVRGIFEDASDPAKLGDLIRKIANVPIHVGERGAANWVKPELDRIIAKPATDYFPNDVVHDAQHIQDLVKAYTANDMEKLATLAVADAKYVTESVAQIVLARGSKFDGVTPDGRVVNEAMYDSAVMEQAFNDMLESGRVAKVKQNFQYNAGKKDVIHPYNQTNIKLSEGLADFKLQVNAIAKAHSGLIPGTTTTFLTQAFRDLAKGVKSTSPEVAAAKDAIEPLMWSVFGKPKDPEAMGIWQRAGATMADLEAYMKKAKVTFVPDLAAASEKSAREGISEVSAALDDWRIWSNEIDNPLEFLTNMHFGGAMLLADKAAASLFVAKAGVTSRVPKAGFTKIPDIDPFNHPLMSHMPRNTYINDEILQQVNNLEEMIMKSYAPNSEFGKFLQEKYLPVLGAWKKGVTIYRLGHHVRNLLSSEGIQWTVEGNRYYGQSATAAMRVLMAHKAYDGVDWAKNLESMVMRNGRMEMPTGGSTLFKINGKDVTVDAVYEAANKHGIFTDFRMIEDLFEEGKSGAFETIVGKLSLKDTKLEKMAGGLSEYQAHYSRLHHFTQILMKEAKKAGKPGSKKWDEIVEAAAIKVRRHHPDGMTLTPFERAYVKPFVPFYSWFRQVIPVVAEGIYQNPGRFMVYPKASYNMAVAMGVDPQSLQDPFPANQLFPDFVTDQLTGPVTQINGNFFMASPGYAYADILNQFVADPKKGAISMVTPFIKVPGELITGTKWDTGVSIKDYSDYVDSNIPGINYLSNFTGVSTTGTVASLLSGQGIDRQYAVDKGNKTVMDQGISVSNWFTGAGLQNISKENYKNLAEIQKRDAAKAAKEQQQGTARSGY